MGDTTKSSAAPAISQADIDAELRRGTGYADGKLRVYGLYQQEISAKDAVKALKKEYGTSGGTCVFLDGSWGFANYFPSSGLLLQRVEPPRAEVTIKWPAVERRIRQLIADGDYLTQEERATYENKLR